MLALRDDETVTFLVPPMTRDHAVVRQAARARAADQWADTHCIDVAAGQSLAFSGEGAKARRRFAKSDPSRRGDLIASVAGGKSFLDMGGMWGIDGDDAFAAEGAGAERIVICDGMDATEKFQRQHAARSSKVEYVQGDLHDPGTVEHLGAFDVVWCMGVLCHSPDPYRLIEHLRRLTIETLILGNRVIPELPGIEGACVFYPAVG